MSGIVIIGAGQAGATLSEKLRSGGYDGDITLIGEEPHLPYQRPPLSKKYLLGEMDVERLYLRPESFYQDQSIMVRRGVSVKSIDRAEKQVHLSDGQSLGYDMLALTTGSVPRRLPAAIGGDLGGVHVVRNLSDVDHMGPDFGAGGHVLIVGGGYIGLEAAAVAASRGLKVTLVEAAERILQRVACRETSDFFRELHTNHGVDIREGVGLKALTGHGIVSGAELSSGDKLEIDFAIVGVGITPAIELAEAAGLEISNGIKVDSRGMTSDEAIFAAGDCCSFPYRGERIRLESVPNAIDQAEVVAKALLDQGVSYEAKPWFWSDQYDVKLQIAGLNTGYDRVISRKGTKEGSISFWYFKGLELLAVDAMNDPRAYMMGKRWIEAGLSPKAEDLGAEDLKTVKCA